MRRAVTQELQAHAFSLGILAFGLWIEVFILRKLVMNDLRRRQWWAQRALQHHMLDSVKPSLQDWLQLRLQHKPCIFQTSLYG